MFGAAQSTLQSPISIGLDKLLHQRGATMTMRVGLNTEYGSFVLRVAAAHESGIDTFRHGIARQWLLRLSNGHEVVAAFDPDCVKTCTDQKPLESYSNKPPNHPRLKHRSTNARREPRGSEKYKPWSFRDFCASALLGAKRRASREKGRTSDD